MPRTRVRSSSDRAHFERGASGGHRLDFRPPRERTSGRLVLSDAIGQPGDLSARAGPRSPKQTSICCETPVAPRAPSAVGVVVVPVVSVTSTTRSPHPSARVAGGRAWCCRDDAGLPGISDPATLGRRATGLQAWCAGPSSVLAASSPAACDARFDGGVLPRKGAPPSGSPHSPEEAPPHLGGAARLAATLRDPWRCAVTGPSPSRRELTKVTRRSGAARSVPGHPYDGTRSRRGRARPRGALPMRRERQESRQRAQPPRGKAGPRECRSVGRARCPSGSPIPWPSSCGGRRAGVTAPREGGRWWAGSYRRARFLHHDPDLLRQRPRPCGHATHGQRRRTGRWHRLIGDESSSDGTDTRAKVAERRRAPRRPR